MDRKDADYIADVREAGANITERDVRDGLTTIFETNRGFQFNDLVFKVTQANEDYTKWKRISIDHVPANKCIQNVEVHNRIIFLGLQPTQDNLECAERELNSDKKKISE